MRSDPTEYQLVAPGTLQAVVSLLAAEPGAWLPIAGGTDVMVQYAAGRLPTRKLVSIWNLPELRRVEVSPGEIHIGAGCTYTDLREHQIVRDEFPLLACAAGWTGGIANQNRGTLGGNIVNASPAADSLPALLAYDAELILVSARGQRRLAYRDFHTDYKKTNLAADELIQGICLPRQFAGYLAYTRKVGARNAQAISKVCVAALGRAPGGVVEDVRIALGSVAPVPLRLAETERLLKGKRIDPPLLALAMKMAVAAKQILPCCGSTAWAEGMAARRPFADEATLLAASDETWRNLARADWMEAFRSHPRIGEPRIGESRIGESRASQPAPAQSSEWATQEQRDVAAAGEAVKIELAQANKEYEHRFNQIFIVCASGKSGPEILGILRHRLRNDTESELHEAAEQQRLITHIRLKKWLSK